MVQTWHHLAWVRNSGTLKMYLDGVEVGSYSTTYDFSRGSLAIGRDAGWWFELFES